MCMCYEGECRHKKVKPKSTSKIKKTQAKIEVLDDKPWWNLIPKKEWGKYFLRRTDNKLMFFTGRKDCAFAHLNMARGLTLKQANCLIGGLELIDIPCEAVTLETLKKELQNKKTFVSLQS